ncbi:MAG: hypothetical protein PVJ57_02370 [Phycisphaerae bacterium]|jgi:hypothetical protein
MPASPLVGRETQRSLLATGSNDPENNRLAWRGPSADRRIG